VAVTAPGKGPMTIDVLGTEFNVQAYADEPLRTATLVSGKVRVSNGASGEVLAPGQQAVLRGSHQLTVAEADIDAATAWKRGLISLQDASIEEIMRQVERWYDVDVVYEGEVKQQFLGKIPRSMKLSDILKVLESTGWVHFEVNGRTVTVKP
jgi:ferric-dicitrate binding protein FerR (iron transport regulator)